MESIPERIDSKFRFVLLAATRAEQLMQGATPKVDDPSSKVTTTAMEEIVEDVVNWDYGPAPETEEGEDGEGEEVDE